MVSISIFLGFLPILASCAGFQDVAVREPIEHLIVARAPQADDGLGAAFCSGVGALFSACNAVSPGIFSMDNTDIAECLCYSSTSWEPSIFDDSVSSCADYAVSALPATDYSLASAFIGFCTSVGDYQKGANPGLSPPTPVPSATTTTPSASQSATSPDPTPKATTPSPRPSASGSAGLSASGEVNIFSNSACSYISFALSFCNSATPGWSTMDVSSQAPCLCYSSTKWSPDGFDGPVKTCAEYVSTAAPSDYSDIAAVEGFCTSVGDITLSPTSGSARSTGGGSNTGGIGIGIGGGGIGVTGLGVSKSTTIPSPSTTPRATTTPPTGVAGEQTPVPTTSSKSGNAPPKSASMGWTFGFLVVAVSAVTLL